MNIKKKVLHLLWTGDIGGAEEYVTTIIEYFDPSKYEVHLCFLSGKGPIFEEIQKVRTNVNFIGMKSGYDIFGALGFIKYLYRERFDIIHSHTENIIINLIIAYLKKPKKIFTEHVSPGADDIFKKRKIFYKLFSNSYHVFIAISEFVKQKLVESFQLNPVKIVVVYNGVRIDKYNIPSPHGDINLIKKKNDYVIGFVGRMQRFKRPDLFIKIAAELIKRNDKFYFIMVGDGPELTGCRELIAEYKINDHFKLLGFRRDIPNLLKSFDALLFTSVGEGFGVVLLEAMAAGTPVFAFNGGAIPEIIRHKENGFLCDSEDTEVIAEQIIITLNDKELIAKITKSSIEDVNSKFSIINCAQKTQEIYENNM